jgi:hypothetical protein
MALLQQAPTAAVDALRATSIEEDKELLSRPDLHPRAKLAIQFRLCLKEAAQQDRSSTQQS